MFAAAIAAAWLLVAGSAQAAFPGENGKIAFTRSNASFTGFDIYSINPDGSGLQQLTTTGDNSEPAWAANGRRLAFTSKRDGNTEIYVMDQNGGGQTRLTNDPAADSHPAWSPDGDHIVFQRYSTSAGLGVYVMEADGTGVTKIGDGADPVWSPDGRRIAFVDVNNITLVNPDGSDPVALTHYPVPTRDSHIESFDPNWSPDGGLIAFERIGGNGPQFFYDLHVVRADGSGEATVYLNTYNGEGTWSPDGQQIVVAGYTSLDRIDVSSWDFLHSPPFVAIPGTDHRDVYPDWQPSVLEPRRGDYKNASQFCAALEGFLGGSEFGARYRNHGACVSRNRS